MRAVYWFFMTKGRTALTLAILFAMIFSSSALARPEMLDTAGDNLDTTFDNDGKVTTDFGSTDYANAVAIQPDGKIVAAGSSRIGNDDDFSLARYNSDGSLDVTFGFNGVQTTDFSLHNDYANAIAIQPDGRIILAGYTSSGSNSDFALVRYNSNGSLDTTFGAGGRIVTNFFTVDRGQALALQLDGKILVAGWSQIGGDDDFVLIRYNSNGSLDTTFEFDGALSTDFGGGRNDLANAIVVQPDGKIVVAGYSILGANADFALVRYNNNGSLDTTFSADGMVTTDFGSDENYASAIALQPDGKIVVAGSTGFLGAGGFLLMRYNSNGSLDTTFGTDGKTTIGFGNIHEFAKGLAVQPDGKIVVAGDSSDGLNSDIAVARLNTNGSLDIIFGINGEVLTPVGSSFDLGQAVALQADGKIVVAGYSDNGINNDFALVRYRADIATFADVPTSYWAWNWIERIYFAGITGGCSLTPLQYCPEASVTRAEMAVFLERAKNGYGYTPPPAPSTGFADVPPSHWAAAWIKQLAAEGITSGCGGNNFCPENNVTRAQLAVFLLKAKYGASYLPPAVGVSTSFSDIPTNYWAAAWIKQLAAEGITTGCAPNLYCPDSPVTRAQMAVFLVRTFNLP